MRVCVTGFSQIKKNAITFSLVEVGLNMHTIV